MVRCLSATETGEREKAQRRRKIQWYVLISLSSGNLLSHLFEGVQPYHANLSVTYKLAKWASCYSVFAIWDLLLGPHSFVASFLQEHI
jgi:hypothetical protein